MGHPGLRFPSLLVAVLLAWAAPVAAEVVRIGGTGGAIGVLTHLGKPFEEQTGIVLEVIPSLGSGGGIKAVGDGALELSITGRYLSASELARGLREAATLRTPYVFATSKSEPVTMGGQGIVAAFADVSAAWPDGTRIKPILRPRAEDDNVVISALFPGMAAALESARGRPELSIATTDQDNADLAETLPGSFIGATYTQVIMEKRDLRLVAIDGVPPGMATFESGRYRYGKVFHIISPRQPSVAAARFVQFLSSEDGVRALREGGCLPGTE